MVPSVYRTETEIITERENFLALLSDEELIYLETAPTVIYAAENYNYPISFHSEYYGGWFGIAHDVLSQISDITGITFTRINTADDGWPEILGMMSDGKVQMITELLYSNDRAKRFILSEPYCYDYYTLISKLDYPTLQSSDVSSVHVGVVRDTIYADLFRQLYPTHRLLTSYNSSDELYLGLANGEVDVVMARNHRLLSMINLYGESEYRSNLTFGIRSESRFGFNSGETMLRSVINKALEVIDTEIIASSWLHAYYYQTGHVTTSQRPLYITTIVLLVITVIFISGLFVGTRAEITKLAKISKEQIQRLR